MRKFRATNESKNHRVGNVKLPKFATEFLDNLKSTTQDPAMLFAELIGLYLNTPIADDDFLDNLQMELKNRKISL